MFKVGVGYMEFLKCRKILLCFSMIFVVFFSITNVYASDGVTIKSIDLVDKSINTTEASKAKANGLSMDFDLKFKEVNDYAKYKIVVENKDSKDYKISVDSNFENSKYISYKYDNADILKANSDTEFYVTVTYNKKLDESNYVDGKYSEKNSAVLKLSDGVNNPKTFNNSWSLIILVVMCVTLIFLFTNKKNRGMNVLILFSLLSVPLFVKAIDYLKITVNYNVVIENGYSVDYAVMAGFIKASEVDNYDLSHADCNDNSKVYAGSISEENRYLYCEGIIYKGKKKYAPGEKVSVSNEKPVAYNFDFDNCKYSDGSSVMKGSSSEEDVMSLAMGSTAPIVPIGDVICPSPQKMGFDFYLYSREISNYAGYPIGKDDNISMNFTNASDNWQDDGEIFADDNSTFVMPNHKVLLVVMKNG